MKRVILKIFMVMAAVLLSCANLLAGSISWEVKDSVLTISGTGDMPDYPMGGGAPWLYSSGFSKVVIKNGILSIGTNSFYRCTKLKSITIPNSVTNIGGSAFSGCTGLTSITIPNSVTNINDYAFYDCTGLKVIDIYAKTPPSCWNSSFRNVDTQTCKLVVPAESLEAYKNADIWKDFYNITAGIDGTKADEVKVTATGNEITVTGAAYDAVVEVYGVNGALVYRGNGKSVAVPSAGVYVVRVAGKAIKVAVN